MGNGNGIGNGNGKNLTKHHIVPKSRLIKRGGEIDLPKDQKNRVFWSLPYHSIWHSVFRNLTITEIHQAIDSVECSVNIFGRDLFGDLTATEAHLYVEQIHAPGTSWHEEDFVRLQEEIKAKVRNKEGIS
jgi:hypothetical protein